MESKCSVIGDNVDFQMDTALLRAYSTGMPSGSSASLWMQSAECCQCAMEKACDLPNEPHGGVRIMVDTRYPVELMLAATTDHLQQSCVRTFHFGEQGIYNVTWSNGTCNVMEEKAPTNTFLPLVYAGVALALAAVCLSIVLPLAVTAVGAAYRRRRAAVSPDRSELVHERAASPAGGNATAAPGTSGTATETLVHPRAESKQRLACLDIFRGLSILLMIFVNYGGGHYTVFAHSIWNGLTMADLVFPWFMFISGASIVLSVDNFITKNANPDRNAWATMYFRVVKRAVVLFVFGVFFVNTKGYANTWDNVRIMGVLQRFAIAGLLLATMRIGTARQPFNALRQRKDAMLLEGGAKNSALAMVMDLSSFWVEWVVMAILTALWLALTFFLPVEGCPSGYLGPGGKSGSATAVPPYKYGNCTGGAAGYIDRMLLGESHMYETPTCARMYDTHMPYDPEGLLGSLMSTLAAFLGMQAGNIFKLYERPLCRMVRLGLWSLTCGVLAGALCGFKQNGGWIPINKNLWSLSFVLATAATGFAILAILFIVTDHRKWWHGAPFYFAGMNPLLLYVGHEIFESCLLVSWPVAYTHTAQLAMDIWGVTFWTLMAYYWKTIGFYWVL